jgi:hypothetical protein
MPNHDKDIIISIKHTNLHASNQWHCCLHPALAALHSGRRPLHAADGGTYSEARVLYAPCILHFASI